MRFAFLENNVVVNVVEGDKDFTRKDYIKCVKEVAVGWLYSDGAFAPPPLPPRSIEDVIGDIEAKHSELRKVGISFKIGDGDYFPISGDEGNVEGLTAMAQDPYAFYSHNLVDGEYVELTESDQSIIDDAPDIENIDDYDLYGYWRDENNINQYMKHSTLAYMTRKGTKYLTSISRRRHSEKDHVATLTDEELQDYSIAGILWASNIFSYEG